MPFIGFFLSLLPSSPSSAFLAQHREACGRRRGCEGTLKTEAPCPANPGLALIYLRFTLNEFLWNRQWRSSICSSKDLATSTVYCQLLGCLSGTCRYARTRSTQSHSAVCHRHSRHSARQGYRMVRPLRCLVERGPRLGLSADRRGCFCLTEPRWMHRDPGHHPPTPQFAPTVVNRFGIGSRVFWALFFWTSTPSQPSSCLAPQAGWPSCLESIGLVPCWFLRVRRCCSSLGGGSTCIHPDSRDTLRTAVLLAALEIPSLSCYVKDRVVRVPRRRSSLNTPLRSAS
jgi:hypothetical protein